MSFAKPNPGPHPASCHKCREGCDISVLRCEERPGRGFEYIGYEDDEPHARDQVNPSAPILSWSRPILPAVPVRAAILETPGSIGIELSKGHQALDGIDASHNPGPPILAAALLYNMTRPIPVTNEGQASEDSLEDFDRPWQQYRSASTTVRRLPTRRSSSVRRMPHVAASTKSTSNRLSRIIEALRFSIPLPVDATQIMEEGYVAHLMSEYCFQRCSSWFMIPPTSTRDSLIARSKASKPMIWALWLGTKLYQALSQDPCSTTTREYITYIDKIEQGFTTDPRSNPPLEDVADRLLAQLELIHLKFTTVDSASGYTLLRKTLPRFLRLVAADTNLLMEYANGNLVVSFSRTLGSPRHELERFVMYDTAAAFVLGVPPLVEYGYDFETSYAPHGFEWIHGIPFMLVEIISRINSRRAGSKVTPLDDWQVLERRILAWQPELVVSDREESGTGSVARLAVQESWRHVILIYLYMVCVLFIPRFVFLGSI
ncbi:unnamed protein product [Rhizoctonia solani]|uniref:Uncharacterized protein n=1 Tax=Rhizoctonia solani TaxID=456999 RepID=A0A8H3BX93_9AGAM|nr:unnamed protein product [Rhizoctonia solani]